MHPVKRLTNEDGKNVILTEAGGEWHVMVEEPGHATIARSFEEGYAASFSRRLNAIGSVSKR